MATLEKIRNRAGLLIGIVIGMALLAFVLGDLFKQGGQAFRSNQREVAEISGESIDYRDFQKEIENLVNINKFSQNESTLDEEKMEQIREEVWERLTRKYVMADEYEELGIDVSTEELWDMVQGENIHPMIKQIFSDPETGELNTMAIIRFLKTYDQGENRQRKAYWLFLEDQMIKERKFNKFNNLVNNSIYITSNESEKFSDLISKRVDINYIVQEYTDISDSKVQVEKSELKDYYKTHKANYKQSASRDVEYVTFDIEPTQEDKDQTKSYIKNIKPELDGTNENKEFVNLNSDVQFDNNYRKKDELSDSIADFMFSEDIGAIYGPYFEDDMYKVSKLVDIKRLPDSVEIRQILIQPDRQTRDIQKAKQLADSLTQEIEQGADFKKIAEQHSDDQTTASEGGYAGWIHKENFNESVVDTAQFSETGAVKQVQTNEGFRIIKVLEKGQPKKKVQVATVARRLEPSSKTYQNIYSKANKFVSNNDTYDKFNKTVEKEELTKRTANNVQPNSKDIPGLEDPDELIRAAFETDENKIISSEDNAVFEINDKFVIGFVTEIKEEGTAPFDQVREDIKLEVKEKKKADQIAKKMDENLAKANSIESMAKEMGLTMKQASNINYNSVRIPDIGSEPKIAGAAAVLEEGKLSYPIKGENGVYIIEVTNITNQNVDPQMYEQRELEQIQQTAAYRAYEALKEAADIKDKRYRFY
ncbi:MAG: SurA N-terminal domain-containing protein [Bacteroidota bacterium]